MRAALRGVMLIGSLALGGVACSDAAGGRRPETAGEATTPRGENSKPEGPEDPSWAEGDRLHMQRLAAQRDVYEAAVSQAVLDPNNPLLASAYFDLFVQSEPAASRFLEQLDFVRDAGVSEATVIELRFRSYVDARRGRRFEAPDGQRAGEGLAALEQERLGRAPTEREVQEKIRADQARRTQRLISVLEAQGFVPTSSSADGTAQEGSL